MSPRKGDKVSHTLVMTVKNGQSTGESSTNATSEEDVRMKEKVAKEKDFGALLSMKMKLVEFTDVKD